MNKVLALLLILAASVCCHVSPALAVDNTSSPEERCLTQANTSDLDRDYEKYNEETGKCEPTSETASAMESDEKASDFCTVPQDIQAYRASWRWLYWFDEPFRLLLGTIAKLADTSFSILGDLLLNLIMVGVLIWICWHVLSKLANPIFPVFGSASYQIVKPFCIILFKTLIAYLIIKSGGSIIYDFFINPAMKLAVGVTQLFGNYQQLPMNIDGEIAEMLNGPSGDSFRGMTETIMTFLSNLFINIMDIIVIGMIYIRYAFQKGTVNAVVANVCFIPTFGEFMTGAALVFVGGMLMLQIPFRLMTAMLRLAYMAVFMPIAVAGWVFPFKPLKEFPDKMVKIVVHVAATMIFSAITVFVIAQFLDQALGLNKIIYESAPQMYERMAMVDGSSDQNASALIKFLLFAAVLIFVWLLAGRINILGKIFEIMGDVGKMAAGGAWGMIPSAADNSFAESFSGVGGKGGLKDSTLNSAMLGGTKKFYESAVYGSLSPIRFINANIDKAPGLSRVPGVRSVLGFWKGLELDRPIRDRGAGAENRLFGRLNYGVAMSEYYMLRGIGRMNRYNPMRWIVRRPYIHMQRRMNRQFRRYRRFRHNVDARYDSMGRLGKIGWWLPYRVMHAVPGGMLLTKGFNRLIGRTWP